MTRRGTVLFAAAALFLCVYAYTLTWAVALALALPAPSAWGSLFPTHLSGVLTWMIVVHTLAILIVSIPFALLIARFGGPHAPVIALGITLALFAAISLPPLITYFGTMPVRVRVVSGLDQVKLILVLPLLVWLMRKLPSNTRWRLP